METRLDRNAAGYYDPTAYKALTRITQEEKKMSMVRPYEIWRARFPSGNMVPVLVLWSDEKCTTITRLMEQLPEKHGPMVSVTGGVLDLSKISYLYVSEFKNRIRVLDPNEEERVKKVLAENLGLVPTESERLSDRLEELDDLKEDLRLLKEERDALRDGCDNLRRQLLEMNAKVKETTRLSIQLDVYRGLYADLLKKVMEG